MTVLLVEDNRDDEWLTLRALAKTGITDVRVARDGPTAIRMLHGDGSNCGEGMSLPDIIMLDLRLPRLDGIEVLKRIRSDARTTSIRVVVLTSSEDPRDIGQCRELGVEDFCSKPINEPLLHSLGLMRPDNSPLAVVPEHSDVPAAG